MSILIPPAQSSTYLPNTDSTDISRNSTIAPDSDPSESLSAAARPFGLELVTFDGDVTLYDDGATLEPQNPVIPLILRLMGRGSKIGIVTAAGYTEAEKYAARLYGLLTAITDSRELSDRQRRNLVVMGGESSYLFRYDPAAGPSYLSTVPREEWVLHEMASWSDADIQSILDTAALVLEDCVRTLALDALLVRKPRAVGIVPRIEGRKFPRESLEETVLVVQKTLEQLPAAARLPFCAFNGGNDVFVDIGDKSWGVLVCQRYFGRDGRAIEGGRSLHVGDQFLSAGANDFKARLACTTAWIANPAETVALLEEVEELYAQVEKGDEA